MASESILGNLGTGGAASYVPESGSLPALADAAQRCTACSLYRDATQAVFGEGRRTARLMLIGEQPGDHEDLEGRPFVGPAGQLLDAALSEAGIDRADAYVTNVVKHFKWKPRGKRRLHQKPRQDEIDACGPWLAAEVTVVAPQVVVCLGATAAQALLGRAFRVTQRRGEVIRDTDLARFVVATVHPSSVLRARGADARRTARSLFVEDLRQVASLLA